MKRYFTLILLVSYLILKAQCPAPSNFSVTNSASFETILSWTENGSANTWEVAVTPNYVIGSPPPTFGTYTTSNPFAFTNVPPGCYVFYVRSICSTTDVSPWAIVASSGCSTNVYTYIASLSNDTFLLNSDNNLKIYPNPAKNTFQINCNSNIKKVIISDSLGKVLLIKTQDNNEINVESLSKGIYLIEVYSGEYKFNSKFVKE